MILLDFGSQDLGGNSVLDGDYLTMLGSSDKLMSGEYEALERLQAELELYDDPNRPEEVAEQITVESHMIEEEVCDVSGTTTSNSEEIENVKDEIDESESQFDANIITQIKSEHKDEEQENGIISFKQKLQLPEIISVGSSSSAIKRSAPQGSVQGNPQSKKSVGINFNNIIIRNICIMNTFFFQLLTKVMVNTIPSTSTGRNTQQILLNVPIGQRSQIGSTRTITLTQARQMGLLAPGCRLQPVASNTNSTQNKVCHNFMTVIKNYSLLESLIFLNP